MRSAVSRIIHAREGFNPALLFRTGTKGLWLDPSDIATLWQVNTRTTPVTADADVVGYVDDKSGSTRDFTAALTARPLYKTTDGIPSLLFDGSNDVLGGSANANALTNNISAFTLIMGFNVTANAAIGGIFGNFGNTGGSRINFFKDASDLLSYAGRRLDADSTATLTGTANNGKPVVYSSRWDLSSTEIIVRVNKREMSRSNAFLTAGSISATDSNPFNIGGQNGTNFAAMSLYGVIAVADVVPMNTLLAAETWMAHKMRLGI